MVYKNYNKKSINTIPDDSMELFQNNILTKPDNLIINGNFLNGNHPNQFSNQSGHNKIVNKSNPSSSSYILEQKKSDDMTYYELSCDNMPNSKFVLLFLFSCNDIKKVNLSKLIRVRMPNKEYKNEFPNLTTSIVQTVNYQENDWYMMKTIFVSSSNVSNKMYIDLNYTDDLVSTMYFGDLTLYRVLMDAENFIYNDKLISFVDGLHYSSNMTTWKDLSGNGNNFTLSSIPMIQSDALLLDNISLKGFPSNKLSNDFSICFMIQSNTYPNNNRVVNEEEEEEEEDVIQEDVNEEEEKYTNDEKNSDSSNKILLSIPGNNYYAFEIELNNSYLYFKTDNKRIKSSKQLYLSNKSMITITYDHSKSMVNIYQNGENIISAKVNKFYLNEDNIYFNRNKNISFLLYSVICYNKIITDDEMYSILDYYMQKKNKNFKEFDVNIYYLNTFTPSRRYSDSDRDSTSKSLFSSVFTWSLLNDYLGGTDDDSDDGERYKKSCSTVCELNCRSFLNEDNDSDKYSDCIDNCKNVFSVCNEYCDDKENKNSKYCYPNNSKNKIDTNCPIAYKKNGKYYIYIAPDSKYAIKYGYYGEQLYGSDWEKSKKTYQRNFPDCPLPDVFLHISSKNKLCPFIVNDMNPCQSYACSNVDWNVSNYKDLELSESCKKAISTYCHLNHELDEICYSWKPENREKKECIEMRKFFEDPKEHCKPSIYEIEEHPDFHNYIRKDKIPCWGCNVDD